MKYIEHYSNVFLFFSELAICMVLIFTLCRIEDQVEVTRQSVFNQVRSIELQASSIEDLQKYNTTMLRPYVFIDPELILSSDSMVCVTGELNNVGITPAYNILSIRMIQPDTASYKEKILDYGRDECVYSTLFPNQSLEKLDPKVVAPGYYYIHYLEYDDEYGNKFGCTFIYLIRREGDIDYYITSICSISGLIES